MVAGRIVDRWGLSIAALAIVACDPFHTEFADVEPAQTYTAESRTDEGQPDVLRVMTYNVKFGGGRIDFFFDCHGDRVLMTREEVLSHLQGLAREITSYDPDVIFLQEVDVLSKRAAFIDQVQWLLDHTPLDYGVYASQWRADFVPSDGIGAVDSGNAILSKLPLRDGTRLALPLRSDQSSLERYFYLRRNILRADLGTDPPLRLVAIHTAAYSKDGTKLAQIERFHEELNAAPGLALGGGDLNALPPGSGQVKDFPDSVCTDEEFQADDYSEEVEWLSPLYADYASAVPLSEYQADNAPYFTHTTDRDGFWNRKLDYLFTNATIVPGSGLTHQGPANGGSRTMDLSDHAPLSMEIELR